MKVYEVMNPRLLPLRTRQTIGEVSRLFIDFSLDASPVLNEEQELVGLITKNRLLQVLSQESPAIEVQDIMLTDPITIAYDDDVPDIRKQKFTCRPVMRNGQLVGMLYFSDILVALTLEIQKGKKEIEAAIDAVYNPVIEIDNDFRIKIFNRQASRLLGIDMEEARGANAHDLLGGTEVLDSLIHGNHKPLPVNKLVIGDRSFLPYRNDVVQDGNVIGSVLVLREISEFEELVRQSQYTQKLNRELDAIFESSFDGLYVTDGQAITLRLNKGFERITGVTAAECVGRHMDDLVKEGKFSRSGTLLALEKKERVTISLVSMNDNELLVTSNPIFDEEGNIILVVTNVRDITELNELQRKLEQVEGLTQLYRSQLEQIKLQTSRQLVFNSTKMKELLDLVLRVTGVDSTVLIQGESGVGKELIAEIIHSSSNRKDGPLIKVNCGAIPENLLESELFGYEAGAFTGASKSGKVGLFELAQGGILFLDEIGELPLNLQVKLLRFLQDKEMLRVGGEQPITVDVRILAGTNRNLVEMIANHQFRLDLYYRLNVIPIFVPPLRERPEDVPVLANYFLNAFNDKYQMNKRLHKSVIDVLMEYHWPGNVRELENLMERMVVTSINNIISMQDLPASFKVPRLKLDNEQDLLPLRQAVENTERELLEAAFARFRSSYQVAAALQVNQSTVIRKAAKYGIKRQDGRS
ncbi:sigma 54-interacting transcriptional regulator [Syntrophomonas wolfei]|jgi:PAS domain S-box-containing protein|uniref:HTH-type transcriptional regulatory protein TyrR n=1 Tax=Syntrophomonas wolfei TaxID=863 RepID=A0A354YXE0_9FIRM|nr:sigma 54-interacting transcriptional regulator [Syntrophomonas wolfei]HBK54013.1 PAS domain S-box protein [Syntrophomonas wolfei]